MTTLTRSRAARHWSSMVVRQRGFAQVLCLLAAAFGCGNVHNVASRAAAGSDSAAGDGNEAGFGGTQPASAGSSNDAGAGGTAGDENATGGGSGSGSGEDCQPACGVGQACASGECEPCSQLLDTPLDHVALAENGTTVAVADLNGDGRSDLAYTDGRGLHVELGTNAGLAPQPVLEFPEVEQAPRILAHADLDHDLRDDLVLGLGEDEAKVVWGDEAAAFTVTSLTLSGEVTIADFDTDERLDLAIYRSGAEKGLLTLLWGRDGRTFEPGPSSEVLNDARRMVPADVSDDGKLDLVFAAEGALQAFVGDGAGAFSEKARNEMVGLRDIAISDLNEDGKPDLIMALGSTGSDEPWTTGHVGVFHDYYGFLFAGTVLYEAGSGSSLLVADVNGDENLDVVANNVRNSSADVLLGNGDGSLAKRRAYAVGAYPRSMASGDLNGDGRPDIAAVGAGRAVAYNQGEGRFGQRVYPMLEWPEQIRLHDVTGDGHVDALVTNNWGNNLLLLAGTPSGEFEDPERVSHDPDNVGGYSSPIAIADFDHDDRPEVAMIRRDELSLFRRTPAHRFELLSSTPWPGYITSLATGDLDEDGNMDVVATEGFSDVAQVRLGLGNGRFSGATSIRVGDWPNDTFLADMNHDRHLDLVVANYMSRDISIMLGKGDGSFGTATAFPTAAQTLGIQHGDLDGDGWLDVVATSRGSISVLLGTTGGALLPEVAYDGVTPDDSSGNAGPAVALADFDGDGRLDLAAVEESNSSTPAYSRLAVLHGRGDGTLQSPVRYPTGVSPFALAAADLDGNGRPEVAILNRFGNALTVFANRSQCGE